MRFKSDKQRRAVMAKLNQGGLGSMEESTTKGKEYIPSEKAKYFVRRGDFNKISDEHVDKNSEAFVVPVKASVAKRLGVPLFNYKGENIYVPSKLQLQKNFYEDYILDSIDPFIAKEYGKEISNNPKEKLQFVRDTFRQEYGHEIKRQGEYRAFAEWLAGLPTVMGIEFENYKILELAKKSGSLPENATEKQEDRVLNNYWNFMANKTFQLFRKYGVD